jgi:amidophosphoribosyltransferase
VLDDSVVRGTTLRESIIKILSARSAPHRGGLDRAQIRYPDCYGIDMSELGKFIAFQAAVELLRDRGMKDVIHDTYRACLAESRKPAAEQVKCVKGIYDPFTDVEISARISKMLYPKGIDCGG